MGRSLGLIACAFLCGFPPRKNGKGHKPGSLNGILSKFSALSLNLTKIESRPIINSEFEFMFYFDFIGDVNDKEVKNLIAELENGSDNFEFLGSYSEII